MKRRFRAALTTAACVAVIVAGAASPPATAAPSGPATSAEAAPGTKRAEARAQVLDRLSGRSEEGGGPARSAAVGDRLAIPDPVDVADPRADIREVLVGDGGSGALILTMRVEQYTNPLLDPAWLLGTTEALWFLDTSGDGVPELVVAVLNSGTGLVAGVLDAESGVFICGAIPGTSGVDKSYTAVVPFEGCLGDVKRPAAGGIFVLDDPLLTPVIDIAPNSGNLVRFTRPVAGRQGGYAIVTRDAFFVRLGVVAPGGATAIGRFEDYSGSRPVVATASARPFDPGLWSVTDEGEVATQDDAEFYGDASDLALSQPIVGMAVLPDRSGYWLVGRDGGIFSYGDAGFFGSTGGIRLNQAIVGMAATPSGEGYWLVAADGGIFNYGDAPFLGSAGSIPLNRPVVGMSAGLHGEGYWLVASDGGIFSYGLPFHGSTGGITLQQPIVGMAGTRSGGGYRFIARDGGLFTYGDAEFHGSAASPGRTDIVGLATA